MNANGNIIVNEPVPDQSLWLSSFEPSQYLDGWPTYDIRGDWPSKRWVGAVGIASFRAISMESEKLCCWDRTGQGVSNVCILGLKTPSQGTGGSSMAKNAKNMELLPSGRSLILLWRCPNQPNKETKLFEILQAILRDHLTGPANSAIDTCSNISIKYVQMLISRLYQGYFQRYSWCVLCIVAEYELQTIKLEATLN